LHDSLSASEVTTIWRYTNVYIIIIIIIMIICEIFVASSRASAVVEKWTSIVAFSI